MFHKWGELIAKNERKRSNPDIYNYSTFENEFTLKGHIKFDIVLQSKGDRAKVSLILFYF